MIQDAWAVLLLFLIPIGGGIPGGVLLAKSRGLTWPVMTALYFISDLILACVFEPIMWLVLARVKRSPRFERFKAAFEQSVARTTAAYGKKLGPAAIILISFGVDPMSGRMAAASAGYRCVPGWALVIAGDLGYFALLMVSTLFLDNILGDGTWATLVILIVMMGVPMLFRRFKRGKTSEP